MRFFLLALVVVIVSIVGGSYFLQASPQQQRYFTSKVERRTVVESVSATGNAEPLEVLYVQSEILGVVDQMLVTYNDAVVEGQPLAKISSDLQRVKLESALADLETAETGLKAAGAGLEAARAGEQQAQSTLDAARRMFQEAKTQVENDLIPPAQLEALADRVKAAEAGLELVRSQTKAANANVEMAQRKQESANVGIRAANLELNKTELKSPAAGVVLNVNCKIGDTVGRPRFALNESSPALFEIARPLDRMRAVVRVNEVDISKVRVGQNVQFSVDSYTDETFTGVVVRIRNSATGDRSAVSYDTEIEFDNRRESGGSDWMIRPRATCRAEILISQVEEALAVPNDALLFSPPPGLVEIPSVPLGQRLVWVLAAGNKIEPRAITTGVSDGFWTEVVSGNMAAGESVVTGIPASSEGIKIPAFGG